MLQKIRANRPVQLAIGLLTGIAFGFFLQKSGVTNYDVILNQLRLIDFTVVKVMMAAVIVAMLGLHLFRHLGWVTLHPKPGSVGATVVGGLLFGVGFALLGYCPGTIAGAIGQGALDALIAGSVGIVAGTWLFAANFPKLNAVILNKGDFGTLTFPELLKVNVWVVVIPLAIALTALLYVLERAGL